MDEPVQRVGADSDWYGRNEAMIISAVAILLMVWHHLFGFRDYLIGHNGWDSVLTVRGIEIERMLAAFGKICVSIFAFNTGYVIYKQRDRYKSVTYCLRRGLAFLVSYWMVMLLFIAFGYVCGQPLPGIDAMALNVIGLATGPDMPYVNVAFAWYVTYYIVFLIISPLLIHAFSISRMADVILLVTMVLIPLPSVMSPLPLGCLGIVFSKYGIFSRLASVVERRSTVFIIASVLLLMGLRQAVLLVDSQMIMGGGSELIIVPLFILLMVTIVKRMKSKYLNIIIGWLATLSMFVWFFHGIFFTCGRSVQSVIYFTRIPILCYVSAITICLILSYLTFRIRKLLPF